MTYGKVQENDQICIYKSDADGNPTGESLGCHATEDAADAQLAALYADENMTIQLLADSNMGDTRHVMGGTIRAAEDGIVEGYLVAFNTAKNPDFHNTYFDRQTDYMFEDYPIVGRAFILYNHGLDETLHVRTIGKFVRAKIDDIGLWVQAQLAQRDEWEQAVYELAKDGKLGWSSGALPQAVEVDDDGHVRRWPIIEGSLTPQPASPPFSTQIYTRSSYQATLSARDGIAHIEPQQEPASNSLSKEHEQSNQELRTMADETKRNLANVAQMIQQALAALMEYVNDGTGEGEGEPIPPEVQEEMQAELQTQMSAKLAEIEEQMKEWTPDKVRSWVDAQLIEALPGVVEKMETAKAERENQFRTAAKSAFQQVEPTPVPGFIKGGGTNRQISIGEDLKYAHLSAADMCTAVMMKTAGLRQQGVDIPLGMQFSEPFLRHLKAKVGAEVKSEPFGKNTRANVALRSIVPFRAGEQDATDIAGQGTEWVGDYWSTTLWEKARFPTIFDTIASKGMMVEDIPQGTDSANFPTEGSDPTAYMMPEGNSVDSTGTPETVVNINPFGTGNVTLTPKAVGIASSVTMVLEEDSVIRTAQQVNKQLEAKFLETRDQLMINGDTVTTASTNINLIDGTPGTGLNAPYYLMANGFRKLPLVTHTAGSRDAGNTLSLAEFLSTLKLMDGKLRQNKAKCAYIIDDDTEIAALGIPEILTVSERAADRNSLETGALRELYKIDVLSSGFLPESNTAGKVSATAGNNVQGTIMLVYAPYWGFGYKRRMKIETAYSPIYQSTVYVLSARMGIIARGTNASVLSYNVANA